MTRLMKKEVIRVVLVTVLLLLVPFISMQFTDEVMWGHSDFIVMGILLFGVGMAFHLLSITLKTKRGKIILGLILLILFLLAWAELGVGIFGTPWAGS